MSVRRLADDQYQPQAFAFSADNAAWAERRIGLYPSGRQQSAVIPLLMRAQDQEGWISRAAIENIAQMLGMPYIRVLEVATFYTQFQLQPVGTRAHIQVCGTTPCMLRGAEDLRAVCQAKIHPEAHHTNADGTLSWEEVECLGACVNAPMVAIFHDTYEDLTPERLEAIIDDLAAGRDVAPGTQIERLNSAAEGGRTTLTEPPKKTRDKFVPPPAPEGEAKPVAPAASPAAAPAAKPAEKPAAPQAPTTAAKPSDVTEESAPAIKGPSPDAKASETKVSEAKAEGERLKADAESGADGRPETAMREGAVGAESDAGKLDEGKAPGKPHREAPVDGASGTSSDDTAERREVPKANPDEVNPVAERGGNEGALFTAPQGTARDNLKRIAGIGPGIEKSLNDLGIVSYAQLAALSAEDMQAINTRLKFAGRIERDRWIEQADALATGGDAEYRNRFGRDPR